MKKNFLKIAFLICLSTICHAEEANFSFETGIFKVPRVVTELGDYSTEFQLDPDGKFSLTKASPIISDNIGSSSINGRYDGVRDNSGGPFSTDSTDTTIEISEKDISVVLDSFMGGECRLSGIVSDDNSYASGSYQCSDFTSGTWASNQINAENGFLVSIIDFSPENKNTFSSRIIGLK